MKLSALSVVFNLGGNSRFVTIHSAYPKFKGLSFSPEPVFGIILGSENYGKNDQTWDGVPNLETTPFLGMLQIEQRSAFSNFCTVHVTFQACLLCCFSFKGCMSCQLLALF